MLKIVVAFVIFAALSLFVIMKGGDKLDMSGEKHGSEATESHSPAASAPAAGASAAASAAAPAAAPAASGASAAK